MEYGLVLPSYRAGARLESVAAAVEGARRFGYTSVWTTDHILIDHQGAAEYGVILDALQTLAWIAGRDDTLRLGTSVIVVPMRDAPELAKELATIDVLSAGRVIAGVGVGWNRREFENLGKGDRFGRRGAYLDEAIALWRHLWSGSGEPFEGRFHRLDDFVFGPLPAQGAALPIWVGGRADAAQDRAGRLGDGYQSSTTSPDQFADRVSRIAAEAEAAGRPMPTLSARVRVDLDGHITGGGYRVSGDEDAIRAELSAFAGAGVQQLTVDFVETDPDRLMRALERFQDIRAAA